MTIEDACDAETRARSNLANEQGTLANAFEKHATAARSLEAMRAAYRAGIKAKATGSAGPVCCPSRGDLEDSDTLVEILSEATELQREACAEAAADVETAALATAQARHEAASALAAKLQSGAATALENFGSTLKRAMAAAHLANVTHPGANASRKRFLAPADLFGPLGEAAELLAKFGWPVEIRPSWAPLNPGIQRDYEPLRGTLALLAELSGDLS